MTREEAIERFENVKANALVQKASGVSVYWQNEIDGTVEALDMAIEALSEPINCAKCKHYYETEDDAGVHGHCRIDTVTLNRSIQAEMVAVVRCKDCRYYNPIDENKPYPCGYGMYMCNKDDFCSYGERREP